MLNKPHFLCAKEVTLTPAPGWTEAAGRPVQEGEDDGIEHVEVEFRGRRNPDEEREEPVEEPREDGEIADGEAYDSDEERRRLMR